MRFPSILCVLLSGLFLEIREVASERIAKQKIYQDVESQYYCFRRFNATHQVGCQSEAGGNVGVIHWIANYSDIEYIISKGSTAPFIAVTPINFFTTDILTMFKKSGRVAGVMLIHGVNDTVTPHYSPDKSCPNDMFSLYANDQKLGQCPKGKWNSINPALDMLYQDWDFPIFLIDDEKSISEIKHCYETFNLPKDGVPAKWPLCSAELFIRMFGAVNTPTCIRRNNLQFVLLMEQGKYCDPLASSNVFAPIFATTYNQTLGNRSVIVLSSRMDSFSMFEGKSPGADSAVSSMVTLLSVAHTLASAREQMADDNPEAVLNNNILFSFFDGEAFDYIGSSRTVFDMVTKNDFPHIDAKRSVIKPAQMRPHHFSHFIELNQLAIQEKSESPPTLWAHLDPMSYNTSAVKPELVKVITSLLEAAKSSPSFVLQQVPEEDRNARGLPPASLQSFLKKDMGIAGVVLANHLTQYTNNYYNSFLDTEANLPKSGPVLEKHLTSISTTVSKAVYKLFTGKTNDKIAADPALVNQLLECFLRNKTCSLFKEVSPPGQWKNIKEASAYPSYVSVANNLERVMYVTYVKLLLAKFTGEALLNVTTSSDCMNLRPDQTQFEYYWMNGPNFTGVCYKSVAFSTEAVSPAFELEQYDSKEYSTWTESVWSHPRVRIFLKPSLAQEWITLLVGIVILIASFVVVYILDKHSVLVFNGGHTTLPADGVGNSSVGNGGRLTAGC